MTFAQQPVLNLPDVSQPQQLGKNLLQPPARAVGEKRSLPETGRAGDALNWFVVENKDGEYQLTAVPNTTQVDVTSVSVRPDEVRAPQRLNFFGYKIDLNAKVEGFKENYVKNFALTKSHNLMVARFAQVKTAFYGYLLSVLGCSSEDIRKLQKQALAGSIKQNKQLFDENEYNSELMAIVGGGGKKQARAQEKIIGEIRKQLITQANNLGLDGYYTQERILETQIRQCQKILNKLREEKVSLEYQQAYMGVN